MKKIFKKLKLRDIIFTILGLLIGGSVGITATTYVLQSSEIQYKDNKSVQQAIDELYTLAENGGGISETLPIGTVDVSGRLITIPYTGNYEKIRCIYGTNENYGSEGTISNNTCTFTGTTTNQDLYYKLIASDITSGNSGKIYENTGKVTTGNTFPLSAINVGDYIYMKPTSTGYKIVTSLTGYSSDQTINPSELTVWRVIKKNTDGTVDVVSDKVSSTGIYFYGDTGYSKFKGSLNTIASAYTNSNLIQSTRYIGYSSSDANLVQTVYGNLKANNLSGTATNYWWYQTDSKYDSYDCDDDDDPESDDYYYIYYINTSGTKNRNELNNYFCNRDHDSKSILASLRPILTLKSTVMITGGSGTINDYYTLGL